MRLLIFGKTGQVAMELGALCAAEAIEAKFLDRAQANLTDPAACAQMIRESDADIVINAAAYTAVDKAEDDRATAHLVNAVSPIEMARAAVSCGKPFLHISTDYVFAGTGDAAWCEQDVPAPQEVYGRTKLAGELGIAAIGGDHVILRTAWVFSAHGANFVKTMRRLSVDRDVVSVVDDQRGGPTPAADIAQTLIRIARAFQAGQGVSGLFHYAGAPAVSWAEFAEAIFAEEASAVSVNRIPSSQYPTPASRPANSMLDCTRIRQSYGIEQPDWRSGLHTVLDQLGREV
ncbi:dTDP-4-dehydrorhamnose reductase [Planktomarina temperata]|nr:dTDP-4-dehydrorhamnose reductase [Planktomarina temperata]